MTTTGKQYNTPTLRVYGEVALLTQTRKSWPSCQDSHKLSPTQQTAGMHACTTTTPDTSTDPSGDMDFGSGV